MQKEVFSLLGELLEYPQDDYCTKLEHFKKVPNPSLNKFFNFVKETSLQELQELYVRTFELSPTCNLYIGSHIFGDDGFKRGSFMAKLKESYDKYEITTKDIPDFLPNILKLASKLDDKEKYNSLLDECISGPLDLIIASIKNKSNSYEFLLTAIKDFVKSLEIKETQHA